MARAASTCNYDNMRGSSCLHIVSAHPTSKRATQACRRTNAVAVGPVNMMCKLTLTLTNANANFFSSPARSHTDRVARRNCMPQLRASSFRAPHKTQLHAATAASCKPQLLLSTYVGKTSGNMRGVAETSGARSKQAATASHCFHVVITTCFGRKHVGRVVGSPWRAALPQRTL